VVAVSVVGGSDNILGIGASSHVDPQARLAETGLPVAAVSSSPSELLVESNVELKPSPPRDNELKSPSDSQPVAQTQNPAVNRVFIEHEGRRIAVEPGVQYEVPPGEEFVVVLGSEQQVIQGPRWVEFQLSPEQVSGYRMVTYAVQPSQKSTKSAAEGPVSKERPKLWSAAVSALREGRSAEAEAALTRLSEESDPATRDAAALALAQLWHSQGDARARTVLLRLRDSGATELTRSRAAELLRDGR
jgi:hypothetical protein